MIWRTDRCLTFLKVQAVIIDPKSQDLLEHLKRERSLASPTTQDRINSRRHAEKILGPDENVFRIDWVRVPDSSYRKHLNPDNSAAFGFEEDDDPVDRKR